jgi:hypothetical protein
MAKDSSKKLTRFQSAATVVSAELLNRLYGGEYGFNDNVDPTDSLVGGHVHDGLHADGHAQKVNLTQGAHVTGQLPHENLGGYNNTIPAVQKKNVQSYAEDVYGVPGIDHDLAIPEFEEIGGVKNYYLDLSDVRGDIFSVGGQPGWIQGGVSDFDVAVTSANLVLTLNGTWIANTKIGKFTFVNESVNLNVPATSAPGQYFVYVDGTTGELTASSSLPDITIAGDVPVGRFTHNGTNITGQVDLRFFTKDDNRKVLYTVRADGAAGDANAEGCFMSLEAALAWAAAYGTSGASAKTEIHIRGEVIVNSTVTLQVDNISLHGEGESKLVTGASLSPMIDLNGKNSVTFHGIDFRCEHANSTAIEDTSASLYDLKIERCNFDGPVEWERAINLTSNVVTQCQIIECRINASERGINIPDANGCHIARCAIQSNAIDLSPLNYGLLIGSPTSTPTYGASKIDQVYSINYAIGFYIGSIGTTIMNSYALACGIGISVGIGSREIEVSGNFVNSNNIANSSGIIVVGDNGSTAENVNRINICNNEVINSALNGIIISGLVRDVDISGNILDLYAGDATDPTARAIAVTPYSGYYPAHVKIVSNFIRRAKSGILINGDADVRAVGTFTIDDVANLINGVSTVAIDGNVLTAVTGAPGASEFEIGVNENITAQNLADAINDPPNGLYDFVVHAVVSGSTVTVYAVQYGPQGNVSISTNQLDAISLSGATLSGGENNNITNIIISNNEIYNCANGTTGTASPTTVSELGGFGIASVFCRSVVISGNNISEIGIVTENDGTPFLPSANVYSRGIVVWNCSAVNVANNNIKNLAIGISGYSEGILNLCNSTGVEPTFSFGHRDINIVNNNVIWESQGNLIEVDSLPGLFGITSSVNSSNDDVDAIISIGSISILSNVIRNSSFVGIASGASGANAILDGFDISHNRISPFQASFNSFGGGIFNSSLDSDLSNFIVSNNIIKVEDELLGSQYPYVNIGCIGFATPPIGTPAVIKEIKISNNTLYSRSSAIIIDSSAEVVNCSILDNSIYMKEAGASEIDLCRGILIDCGTADTKLSDIKNISISGNTIVGGDGCRISSKFGVILRNISVTNNVFDGTDNLLDPTTLTTPQPDGFYSAFSIHAEESITPGADDILNGVVIGGNIFRNTQREAIVITKGLTSAPRSTRQVNISNNTFDSCGLASGTELNIPLMVGIINLSSTGDFISEVQINQNQFNNIEVKNNADPGALVVNNATVIGLLAGGLVGIKNCQISENIFASCDIAADTTSVQLQTSSSAISAISYTILGNIDISRNQFRNLDVETITTSSSAVSAGILTISVLTSDNISISDNQFSNTTIDTTVDTDDCRAAIICPMIINDATSISIKGNITADSSIANTYNLGATSYAGIITPACNGTARSLIISENNSSNVDIVDSDVTRAFAVYSLATTGITEISVTDNNFVNAPHPTYDAGGVKIESPSVLGAIISDNQIGALSAQAGVGVYFDVATLSQGIVHNNVITNFSIGVVTNSNSIIAMDITKNSILTSGSGVVIQNSGVAPQVNASKFSDNTIYTTNYGIRCYPNAALCSFDSNVISAEYGLWFGDIFTYSSASKNKLDISTYGIYFTSSAANSTINVNSIRYSSTGSGIYFDAVTECTCNSNVIDSDGYCISVSGVSSHFAISGNTMISDTSDALYVTGNASHLTLTGNTAKSTDTNNKGFIITGDLDNSSITGNTIHADLNGIDFTSSSSFTYNSISGNSIKTNHVASVGINFTNRTLSHPSITGNVTQAVSSATGGTGTVPATGTCMSNSGTTTSGAGSWDTWASNGAGADRVLVYAAGGNAFNA